MNGYGTVETIYRQLGIGVIKKGNSKIIFTAGAVRGVDGFQELTEGDEVHYRTFSDQIEGVSIARDVWKKSP